MTPNVLLVVAVGVLFASGVTLLLERTLTRVILGVTLLGNGTNLLILLGGGYGGPPIVGVTPDSQMSDPLAQAMILTAIVITLGMTAFLLAMAYRSWVLTGHDEVQDDIEDRRIMARAERDQGPESQDDTDTHGFTDDTDTMDGIAVALQERPALPDGTPR
jgi:multicomponent Na+:H+ antiporter subunit C